MAGSNNIIRLAAAGVQALQPYLPGKPVEEVEREYGIRDSIKLASNENPLGPPPAALAAIQAAARNSSTYPDGAGYYLKHKLARRLGVNATQVTLGNGSNEILVLLAEAFLQPGLEAVFDQHAFLVYPLAVQATGASACIAQSLSAADPVQPLGHDLAALAGCIGSRTRLVFIANPNNPTGTWLQEAELRAFLDQVPEHVVVVLDEAYFEYVTEPGYPDGITLLQDYPNLVVTRTFSKIYALAGLRIGYAISSPEMAELLNRIRQPFNTSSVAQAAAMAVLDDEDFLTRSRSVNAEGLALLYGGCVELGLRPVPSVGNFMLVDLGRPAMPIYECLLRAGIIVRPVANYGLPDHLRITVGLPEQNQRVLEALTSALRS